MHQIFAVISTIGHRDKATKGTCISPKIADDYKQAGKDWSGIGRAMNRRMGRNFQFVSVTSILQDLLLYNSMKNTVLHFSDVLRSDLTK